MQRMLLKRQRGATMLEILVAVLVLAIGILALVGLQAKAITSTSDAKYRVEAATYADELIGMMWADRTNRASYATFSDPSGVAQAWRTRVMNGLPGAGVPVITMTGTATDALVSVTLTWTPPGLPNGAPPHQLTVQTRMDNNL